MKTKACIALFMIILGSIAATSCQKENIISLAQPTPVVKAGWTLFFHDEFDGYSIDTSAWNITNIKWPYNSELEFYTPRPENIRLNRGNLVITARREDYNGAQYTSGRIESKNKVQDTYGYIEARIKVPYGQGIWPAFWMLMEPSTWPTYYGEIDIMEMIGGGNGKDNVCVGTSHYSNGTSIVSTGSYTSIPWPAKLSDDFHVYAIEWNSTEIKWYLDGVLYFTFNVTAVDKEELRSPQYLIFNVAVGGTWPGSPDGTTVFPQVMYVDWVRWWK